MTADNLLTIPDQEELLSKAYAHAVAARAGYTTALYDLDRDGIDMRIQAGGYMRPGIELQLKATINLGPARDGYSHFALPVRNYELLIVPTQTPRILVVLDLPTNPCDWMEITADSLVLRHRAYWVSLAGREQTSNTHNITVQIPDQNLFDVTSLIGLMDQSRFGRIL
jgi:hypothetical protein